MTPRTANSSPAVGIYTAPVAVDRATAAAMLGMSLDSFERYAQASIKMIRRGRLRVVPVAELHRWAAENAEVQR